MDNNSVLQLVKENKRFKLYFTPSIICVDKNTINYKIVIKYDTEEVEIGNVYTLNYQNNNGYEDPSPTFVSTSTNLQDCITSWDLYSEFIMLLDEAFDRLGSNKCGH